MPDNRRRIKRMVWTAVLVLLVVAGYGIFVEPRWLAVRTIRLADPPSLRVVHISDLHYRGDQQYLFRTVELANAQRPDLVCITGDFVSSAKYLPEALGTLAKLEGPVFAVAGNWDYRSRADLAPLAELCERSGGRLLRDESVTLPTLDVTVCGASGQGTDWLPAQSAGRRIMLVHYPKYVEQLAGQRFDLILAGHSHGGQVRLPLIGAIAVPYGVGRYKLGLYRTPAGPLYVTSGIGTSALPLRLDCRPEIAVIEF